MSLTSTITSTVVSVRSRAHRTAGPRGLDGVQAQVENRPAQARLIDGRGELRQRPGQTDKLDTSMLRGRLDERGDIVNKPDKVAVVVRPLFLPAQRQ